MAIAFNNATDGSNNGGTTNSLTFSHTVGSGTGRLLVVAVDGDVTSGHDDITGVTYAGTSLTFLNKITAGSANDRMIYFYYLLNPASGANNVVASCTNTHYLLCGAADYSGVGGLDASTTNQSLTSLVTTLTTTISTINNNSWAVLIHASYGGGSAPISGAGDTIRTHDAAFGTWGIFDSNGAITPAGSYSMTTSITGSQGRFINHLIGSFYPAGGVSPTYISNLSLLGIG